MDPATRDLLRELDGGAAAPAPPPAPSAPAPRSFPDPSAPPADEETPPVDWAALLRLFAPMLVLTAALAVAGGVLGVFVLLRREALMTLALPQAVAVGAAVGLRRGWPTLPPALASAAAALLYFVAARRGTGGRRVDLGALPAVYVGGLSLSFLLIANHGQDVADLQNLFTGIDVAVSPQRALFAAPALLLCGLAAALLWRRWLLLAQAPAAAELAGARPAAWDGLFLGLLTLALLLGTDSLGVVMVLALLFLPPAAVLPWTGRIPATLAASAALGLVLLAAGFYLSNVMGWPLSQSVGGVGFAAVCLSQAVRRLAG